MFSYSKWQRLNNIWLSRSGMEKLVFRRLYFTIVCFRTQKITHVLKVKHCKACTYQVYAEFVFLAESFNVWKRRWYSSTISHILRGSNIFIVHVLSLFLLLPFVFPLDTFLFFWCIPLCFLSQSGLFVRKLLGHNTQCSLAALSTDNLKRFGDHHDTYDWRTTDWVGIENIRTNSLS